MKNECEHISYLWDDTKASQLDPVGRLVYRSNLLGGDQRITNTSGGNTSSKVSETNPITGSSTEVLWVKGSGGDLRTSGRGNFSSLYQDRLLGLQKVYATHADKGLKSQAEDDMVARYFQTTFNANPRASSIDTPLHGFSWGRAAPTISAHENQTALRGLESAGRRCVLAQAETHGRSLAIPRGLCGLLYSLQARELSRDARPEFDGNPHPGPGHDRLGQG